jgi:hypothetical protein
MGTGMYFTWHDLSLCFALHMIGRNIQCSSASQKAVREKVWTLRSRLNRVSFVVCIVTIYSRFADEKAMPEKFVQDIVRDSTRYNPKYLEADWASCNLNVLPILSTVAQLQSAKISLANQQLEFFPCRYDVTAGVVNFFSIRQKSPSLQLRLQLWQFYCWLRSLLHFGHSRPSRFRPQSVAVASRALSVANISLWAVVFNDAGHIEQLNQRWRKGIGKTI